METRLRAGVTWEHGIELLGGPCVGSGLHQLGGTGSLCLRVPCEGSKGGGLHVRRSGAQPVFEEGTYPSLIYRKEGGKPVNLKGLAPECWVHYIGCDWFLGEEKRIRVRVGPIMFKGPWLGGGR